jgi:hypothetical protein
MFRPSPVLVFGESCLADRPREPGFFSKGRGEERSARDLAAYRRRALRPHHDSSVPHARKAVLPSLDEKFAIPCLAVRQDVGRPAYYGPTTLLSWLSAPMITKIASPVPRGAPEGIPTNVVPPIGFHPSKFASA